MPGATLLVCIHIKGDHILGFGPNHRSHLPVEWTGAEARPHGRGAKTRQAGEAPLLRGEALTMACCGLSTALIRKLEPSGDLIGICTVVRVASSTAYTTWAKPRIRKE